jgi:hypothetical protein
LSIPYEKLSVPERWEWHAAVYAFRRVALDADREERTSPCDPNGDWFDDRLVDEAERRLRAKRAAKSRRSAGDGAAWEALDIENNWARDRGYNDFEHYKTSERIDHVTACTRLIMSLPGPKTIPRESQPTGYGVMQKRKFREYDADELRAGSVALGLERPDETTAGAA